MFSGPLVFNPSIILYWRIGERKISSNMGFHENKEGEEKSTGGLDTATTELTDYDSDDEEGERLGFVRKTSESSLYMTEDEEDEEGSTKIELGPQCSLKDQLEKDKDDESLRKWKEQLLGNVDVNNIGEALDPEVKILSLSILSPDGPVIVLAIPEGENPKGLWFTLKEGSRYSLKFSFQVSNNIVSGLRYTSSVWKTGVKVDSTKEMLGTFCPQPEPYMHVMPEDTTPTGIFARGQYSAKSKFLDDDNNCYLEINYAFDIQKRWPST